MIHSKAIYRRPFILAALAVAALAAGCGGGSAPDSATPVNSTGAVIRGTVLAPGTSAGGTLGASSNLNAQSSSAKLKVSVVGTSLSTSTDGSGQFTLSGVPTGRIELRFEGSGLDARLEIGGLQDGQELSITVRVNGGGVVLVSDDDPSPSPSPSASPNDDDDDAEFTGRLDAIKGSTLTVGGRQVSTDGSTVIRQHGNPVPFSTLKVGQTLEVEGALQTGGSVRARKVTIEDDGDDNGDDDGEEVEIDGRIQSISGSTLVVSARTVLTNSSTEFKGTRGEKVTFSFFKVGDRVEVEGQTQSNGSVLAKKVKAED